MSSEKFSSCVLAPVQGDPSSSVTIENGKFKSSSFYLDSSGRSNIPLPLQLTFPSKEILDEFLCADCIRPVPSNYESAEKPTDGDAEDTDEPNSSTSTENSVCIEAKVTLTFGTGRAINAKVEGVTILASKIDRDSNSIVFSTDIIVRVLRSEGDEIDSGEASGVKTNLEITAAYSERPNATDDRLAALHVLTSLSKGDFSSGTASPNRTSICRLPPFALHVALTHALSISVRSIPGPAMGQTLLALTMKHSDTHKQPVTITSISLHPGVSRQLEKDSSAKTASSRTSQQSVADMSGSVNWGYVDKSDPKLPLVLSPNEAYSTVLFVDAGSDSFARVCVCPLSVTAALGSHHHQNHIVAAADAMFATSRSAVEPADSFRVDMSLQDKTCVVGAPITVNMEISNLSAESRPLMLLVETGGDASGWSKKNKWTLVTDVDGYKFGVGGPDGDRELLSVDAALLLGELRGHTSTKARLRAIPLREGTLKIPNFALICSRSGRRYNCIHRLQAVVQAQV